VLQSYKKLANDLPRSASRQARHLQQAHTFLAARDWAEWAQAAKTTFDSAGFAAADVVTQNIKFTNMDWKRYFYSFCVSIYTKYAHL